MKHTIQVHGGAVASVQLDEEQCEAIVDGMAFVVRNERERAMAFERSRLPHWRKFAALCMAKVESAESVLRQFCRLREPEFPRLELEASYAGGPR